jgi:ribosomal protein L1
MAKKAELLEQAHKLKLDVSNKNTIAEIEAAIAASPKAAKVEKAKEEPKEGVVAKAGKRSTKAIKEAEEKVAKEERKADAEHEPVKQRPVIKIRSKVERKGKKYRAASELVDKSKVYSLKDAVDTTIKTSTAKFDATVELHVRLGVDPRHADQNIRATLVLPEGTGKSVKVAVFAEADDAAKAKTAGADIAGNEEFLQQLDKGVIDFDVLIATPAVMPKLGKYARVLGPKGLMPSPKSGTVTTDIAKAVKEAKAGKVEFRVDSNGIVHLGAGKVSFGSDRLVKNIQAVLASIKNAKPASVKGNYLINIHLTSTMGPSVKVDNSEF